MKKYFLILFLLASIITDAQLLPAQKGFNKRTSIDGGGGPSAYHAATDVIIESISVTGTVLTEIEKGAIDRRIRDLHGEVNPNYTTYNVWSKIKLFYGFLGSTANAQKINWKNPPGPYSIGFEGAHTFNMFGWTATGDAANTNFTPQHVLTDVNITVAMYCKTYASGAVTDYYSSDAQDSQSRLGAHFYWPDGNVYSDNTGTNRGRIFINHSGANAYWQMTRFDDLHTNVIWKNENQIAAAYGQIPGVLPQGPLFLGSSGGAGSGRCYSSFLLATSFTTAEMSFNYLSEQAYQTSLGRNN